MAITFSCQSCRKIYEVDGSLAGRKVKCKSCGASMVIPSASRAGAGSTPPRSPAKPAAGRPVDDVDDPYGLQDAASSARGEVEETLLPRGAGGRRPAAGQTSAGVPVWVWVLGGVGSLLAVVVMVIFVNAFMTGFRRARQLAAEKQQVAARSGDDAVAPIAAVEDSAEAPTAVSKGFQRDNESAAASQSAWRVKPDPAPVPLVFPPIAKLTIPVPDHFGGNAILYPTTPSPFVIVGGNDNADQYREVYDLRKPAKIGRLAGKIEVAKPMALSPDGAYFVVHTNPVPRTTDIWRVADAKRIGRIEDGDKIPDYLDIAGPGEGRLVLGTSYAKTFQVWDFLQGKKLFTITTPDGFDRDSVTLSPGRRYMALTLAQKNKLQVYDLSNGNLAGQFEIPKDANFNADCEGMAFSPDGKALTLLYTANTKTHLMTLDATTGLLESDFETPGNNPFGKTFSYDDQVVQWLPDASGWLIRDQSIVERKSGQTVFAIPFAPTKYQEQGPRRILDFDRIITTSAINNRQVLRLDPLPKTKIVTAMTIARGGGSAADASLPPVTAANLAGAKQVDPVAGPVAWSAPVDAGTTAKPNAAGKPITLKTPALDVVGLLASGPDGPPLALVVSSPGARLDANKGKPSLQGRQVDRYDLATGRPLGRFEIPSVSMPTAFDPTGAQFLMTHVGGLDRVDVHTTEGGTHVVGWRPYEKESGDNKNVAWAAFLDAKRVLTVNPAGTLILWSLPDCKAVYIGEKAATGIPVLSPGRKTLAVLRSGTLRLIDPETGAARGDGVSSGHQAESGLKAAAFDPEGNELAAVLDDTLVRWDLKTGQVIGEMPSPIAKANWLQYGAGRHILVDQKVLVDLEAKRPVWYYEGGIHDRNAGGLHRFITGAIGKPAVLKTLEIPEKGVVRAEQAAADSKVKAMLREGSTVSVQIVGNPNRDPEGFRAGVIEKMTERLAAVGVKVADGQPVKIVATFRETDTGKTYQLKKLGGKKDSNEVRTIPIRLLEWELSAVDASGPPIIIARDTTGGMSPGFIEHVPPGENDWDGFLRYRHWLNSAAKVVAHDAPYFIARRPDGSVMLPGWTFLGEPTI